MCPIISYNEGTVNSIKDTVVTETALTVMLNDQEFITMVCSPDAWEELAAGYLLSEGILTQYTDLINIIVDHEARTIRVYTSLTGLPQESFHSRYINTCSGRGKAGLGIAKKDSAILQPINSEQQFTSHDLLRMIGLLDERSTTFRQTGGVHSAALGTNGDLLVRYEDIGRHNAVDKAFGYAFLKQIPLSDKCLVLSGRIASEILLKAACNGVPLVLSRSAPTGMAVELARELGITIVGFARGRRFNVYSHEERIIF
jgi:FdhD protein